MSDWNDVWDAQGASTPEAAPESGAEETVDTATAGVSETPDAMPEASDADIFAFEDEDSEASQVEEFTLPETDDDLQAYLARGDQWAQDLLRTREYARSLQPDTATLETLNAYQELGDVEALQQQVELARKFQSEVVDPNTGQTYLSAQPAFQQLVEESPARALQMFADFASLPDPNGKPTLLDALMEHVGVTPEVFQAVIDGRLVPADSVAQPAANALAINAEEQQALRDWFPDEYEKIAPQYKALTALERKAFWDSGTTEEMQREALAMAQKRIESESTLSELTSWRQQLERQQQEAFQQEVQQAQESYISELRESTINGVLSEVMAEVQLSADAKINTALSGAISAVLTATLEPSFGFAVKPLLEALGCPLREDFYQQLQVAANAAQQAKYLEMVNARPELRARHDRKAQQAAEAKQAEAIKAVKPVLKAAAARLAKAFGGERKAKSVQTQQAIQRGASRPTMNGVPVSVTQPRQPTTTSEKWASVWGS